jgi:surfactin synthase thioesterase subunit
VHASRAPPQLRLFCFAYAGGGASIFQPWRALLPDYIEIVAVQLPGRETRFHEPARHDIAALISELVDATAAELHLPFASFGHSLGTLLSYKWAIELQRRGLPQPRHMIMSGRGAPHLAGTRAPTHLLPDAHFIQTLREMRGTPEELLQDDEAMRVLLPQIRADFALAAAHDTATIQMLPCGLSVYGGLADPGASQQQLRAWQSYSADPIRLRMFPGDHFFLHSARHTLLEAVVRDLPIPASREEWRCASWQANRSDQRDAKEL